MTHQYQNTIEGLLEDIQVGEVANVDDETLKEWQFNDWYHVSNNDGIIAYFNSARLACAFKLMLINQILNGSNTHA